MELSSNKPRGDWGWKGTGESCRVFSVMAPLYMVFALLAVLAVVIERGVLPRILKGSSLEVSESLLWIVVAGFFMFATFLFEGTQTAVEWGEGFLLEYALSLDNMFVFHLVFKAYATPKSQISKALFFGISGAASLRLLFFAAGQEVLHCMRGVRMLLAVALVYSGIQTCREQQEDPGLSPIVLSIASVFAINPEYEEDGSFFVWQTNEQKDEELEDSGRPMLSSQTLNEEPPRLRCTLLFLVVLSLQVVDVIFALDSVGAKVAMIDSLFINFSSSALSMLSMRSLFFLLEEAIDEVWTLQYAISGVLMFIGLKLFLEPCLEIGDAWSFFGIAAILFGALLIYAVERAWKGRGEYSSFPSPPLGEGNGKEEECNAEPLSNLTGRTEAPFSLVSEIPGLKK